MMLLGQWLAGMEADKEKMMKMLMTVLITKKGSGK